MVYIPKKVEERIKRNLTKYKRVLKKARDRDVRETDTVIIVTDMISDMLGYEKFEDITAEIPVRGTYCDLGIKRGDDLHFLIEVKAIGLPLQDKHLKQALDYASNAGIDWVILTNGIVWDVYRVIFFKKPITKQHLFKIDLLEVSVRDPQVIESLFMLCKEGIKKDAIEEFQEKKQAMNKYTIAQILQEDAVVKVVTRELRKLFKGIKIDKEIVSELIQNDVLKRDVIIGDRAEQAEKRIRKIINKQKKKEAQKKAKLKPPEPKPVPPPPPESTT